MQRCQKCKRTYIDDKQKFCTFDGGRLMPEQSQSADLDPDVTMVSKPPYNDEQPTPQSNRPFDPYKTVAASPGPPTSDFRLQPTSPVGSEINENQRNPAPTPAPHLPPTERL